MKQMYLVGTLHPHQIDPCEQFETYLTGLCHAKGIRAIGEESSIQALAEKGARETIAKRVSSSLKILHRYCDPDRDKRAELGIRETNIAKLTALINDCPPGEAEQQAEEEHRKRERTWLQELNQITETPMLFICGSNHVVPFSNLLKKSGYQCKVEDNEWTPNKALHHVRSPERRNEP